MTDIIWTLEKRKLSSLKDYHKNPRTLTKDQEAHLSTSIEKFGIIDKPIINTDGTLIGGHQRKRVLKKLGIKEVECYTPNRQLDEREVEELNIRLNKGGSFDYDKLVNEYDIADLAEWGFNASDFDLNLNMDEPQTEEPEGKHKCPTCGKKSKMPLKLDQTS